MEYHGCNSQECHQFTLRQGFSVVWSLPSRLDWQSSKLQGSSFLHTLWLRCQVCRPQWWQFYVGSGNQSQVFRDLWPHRARQHTHTQMSDGGTCYRVVEMNILSGWSGNTSLIRCCLRTQWQWDPRIDGASENSWRRVTVGALRWVTVRESEQVYTWRV